MAASIFGSGSQINLNVAGTLVPESFTASAGQTLFNLTKFSYITGSDSLIIFINGQKQCVWRDYIETSSGSFTLIEPCVQGDSVDVIGFPKIDLTQLATIDASKVIYGTKPLTNKLQEFVSVKDYPFNAVGDGIVDDTAAVMACYAYCDANNKTMFVPSGKYGTATGFVFDKEVNIVGENLQSVFVSLANNITIVKLTRNDRVPNTGYQYTVENIAADPGSHTGCIGIHSLTAINLILRNTYAVECTQGHRFEGDQYCIYENNRSYDCTIGHRLLDYYPVGQGGGNNNVLINPVAKNCDVNYLLGRAEIPYPLHTITLINAISLGAKFSSYCVFKYQGFTISNGSPESVISATGSAVYDGQTVKAGLGYFYGCQGTIRNSTVATNGQAYLLESGAVVTFDDYSGANCSVITDETSVARFTNGTNPGNGSHLVTNYVDGFIPNSNKTTSFEFPHQVQYCAGIVNHVNDPVTLIYSAAINSAITAQTDWHQSLGICASIRINNGTSNKGISPYLDGAAFGANATFLIGVSLVSSADCVVNVSYSGQISKDFNLKAGIAKRVYVCGGGSASGTLGSFNINIMDASGATVYIGKAQLNVSSDNDYRAVFANIMRNHLYNSGRVFGDVGVSSSAPTLGTFKVGDVVFARTPTAGGTMGWVCTTAGTPGTWKTFGSIAA